MLYCGRLVDCKGPLETIQAYRIARTVLEDKHGIRCQLGIAGDGPLAAACQAAIGNDQTITSLHGALSQEELNTPETAGIQSCHNQIGPQTKQVERFGVGFLESLAAGLPAVTGSDGGQTDFLIEGHNALLFQGGDIQAHADKLVQVCTQKALYTTLSTNCAHILKTHAPSTEVQHYIDLIGSIG